MTGKSFGDGYKSLALKTKWFNHGGPAKSWKEPIK
jgi:hypothetical protein